MNRAYDYQRHEVGRFWKFWALCWLGIHKVRRLWPGLSVYAKSTHSRYHPLRHRNRLGRWIFHKSPDCCYWRSIWMTTCCLTWESLRRKSWRRMLSMTKQEAHYCQNQLVLNAVRGQLFEWQRFVGRWCKSAEMMSVCVSLVGASIKPMSRTSMKTFQSCHTGIKISILFYSKNS